MSTCTANARPIIPDPMTIQEMAALASSARLDGRQAVRAVQREVWRLCGLDLSSSAARQIDPDRVEVPRALWDRLHATMSDAGDPRASDSPVWETRFCGVPVDIIEGC